MKRDYPLNRTLFFVVCSLAALGLASASWGTFDVTQVQDGDIYEIRSVNKSHKCIDIKSASYSDRAEAQIYNCNGNLNQRWKLIQQPGGYFLMRAMHSSKCLDVRNADSDEGRNIQQYWCHAGDNQQWRILPTGSSSDDYVDIRAKHSLKCMTANTGEGTLTRTDRLEQRSCTLGKKSQQWSFTLVAQCGDNLCESNEGEDVFNCPADCGGGSTAVCMNGLCESSEDCFSCQEDCGPCICEGGEGDGPCLME